MNASDQQPEKLSIVAQILNFSLKLPSKHTYYTAWLAAIILVGDRVDIDSLPVETKALFSELPTKLLRSLIERIVAGEELNEEEVLETINYVLAQTKIAEKLLSVDGVYEELMRVTGGIGEITQSVLSEGYKQVSKRLLEENDLFFTEIMEMDNARYANLSTEILALREKFDALRQTATKAELASQQRLELQIFISSPGDVVYERERADAIITKMNVEPEFLRRIFLIPRRWDNPDVQIPMPANSTAQQAVNQYVIKPSECDLVVVVIWSKIGTPMEMDGREYLSGTDYEFQEALEGAQRNNGKPQVWVYHRTKAPNLSADDPDIDKKLADWQKVKTYFATFNDERGRIMRNYIPYDSRKAFCDKFDGQLRTYLRHLLQNQGTNPPPTLQ